MNVRSSKAKGRRLQNALRDILRKVFPSLEEDDIKSQTMGMTGEDIVLSPAAKKAIPYSFECKNVERLDLWGSLEQAESNCDDRCPVLVFTRNRKATYAVIPLDKLIQLIKEK
tara:strand:+ start:335 stop:673 length:339 start_codon:yes stop_codon:yes gene_type:complete